jgi:cytochrome c5
MKKYLLLAGVLALASACTHSTPQTEDCAPVIVDFTHEIQPLIASNCAMSGCHVGLNAAEGVRLSSYTQIVQHVNAGNPEQSHLYKVLLKSGNDRMPPPPMAALTQAQKDRIKLWIEQGAKETNCANACDTVAAPSWSQVSTVFQAQCTGCHQASGASGNVRLDDYAEAIYAVNSRGLKATLHSMGGAPQMPPSGPMSDCSIAIVERWIRAGMPQ